MKTLRCSIVIPTRDRLFLLKRCLAALAKQTLHPDEYEIIVVDDGSKDGTTQAISRYAQFMISNLRVIKGYGHGPATARNLGWRAAQSPLILFTDDDCVPSLNWAQSLVEFLELNPHFAGAGGEIKRLNDSIASRYTDDIGCMNHPGDPYDVLYLVSANASYRRSVLEQIHGFNESFPCAGGEDPELSFRVRSQGLHLARVKNALLLHSHPSSALSVYRMHFRYGRGEFCLLHSGADVEGDRGTLNRLRLDLISCMKHYIHRSDLDVLTRVRFCTLGFVRAYALNTGFRSQRRQTVTQS
jgi:glycosyltransferase involved in cell wall biosynthesis